MARKTKVESLDGDVDDDGFIDGEVSTDKVLSSFNFAEVTAAPTAPAKGFKFYTATKADNTLTDNRKIKTEANIATPRVEGETYTVGRYYKLRYSTAKILNEIKASHHNVNVYMNTLVDEAIRYYYSFGFQKQK
jgi:hypothetical protein